MQRHPAIYLSLIHHPILNKEGRVVTTSVTNFDLHDLARNAKTFGVKKVFIVTPTLAQINMVNYIKDYWENGIGARYNPDRKEAFEILESSETLEQACLTIKNLSGKEPLLVATTAKRLEKSAGYSVLCEDIQGDRPLLLVFGTGFGLTQEFLEKADYILEPIEGAGEYNHLPVRSAVAIVLDRLVNRRKESSL